AAAPKQHPPAGKIKASKTKDCAREPGPAMTSDTSHTLLKQASFFANDKLFNQIRNTLRSPPPRRDMTG
ncbi:hypothetical protein, partial [Chromobacterium piscinae]|uniref:hypothetical protein n=1 Tax=Chromobacterium piscinae TaxID=686831 RepID=UPI0032618817